MRTLGLTLLLTGGALLAADAPELTQSQIDDVIQKFAAKESAFAKAREDYTYRQTSRVQDLDQGGQTVGRWEEVIEIVFNGGKRSEHVVKAPVSTLRNFFLGPEDIQDLRDVQPFVLTTAELPNYVVRYLGHEAVDEIDCHVFAVKPKKMEPGKRYFTGQVWVDDRDLQIVKSYGRGIGIVKKSDDKQFPKFETYREQIDGKYWFPTYTVANDTLHFKDQDARIRETVRYEDYKRFRADTTITFGDAVDDKKDDKKAPTPAPPPAK